MKGRIALAFLGVIALMFFLREKPCANFREATLQTPMQLLGVSLASTAAQQSKGLGGCKEVPSHAGMYFVFPELAQRTFWMKDMLIPIDIIWIQQGIVVGIEKNVPSLPLDTPDTKLPTYTSAMPVDTVLEVATGKAEEYGIQIGSELHIDKK